MSYSATFKTEIAKDNVTDYPKILLEVNHASFVNPIYLINDNQEIVSNSKTYLPAAFDIVLPDQSESGNPQSSISIDNIDGVLGKIIDDSDGASGASIKISVILRSNPDLIEYSVDMEISEITVNQSTVSISLAFKNIYEGNCFPLVYNINNSLGLF